ncbi:MAG: aminoacyl-tRNA hydrolase [Candidatus Brocadiia bacterium]
MSVTEPHLILVCLGNPGGRYAGTRHNAGWLFADYLAAERDFGKFADMDGVPARAAEGALAGLSALLVKPELAMNDCGRVIPPLTERFPFDEHLYAIAHDDLDLPIGSVKGRQKGGHGGHNGVRSMLNALGRRDVVRIKLGVSSSEKRSYDSVADFLLSEFTDEERRKLEDAFPEAERILTGQVKSFIAGLRREDAREEAAATYTRDALEEAREAIEEIPAASPFPIFLSRRQLSRVRDVVTALAKLLRKAKGDPELRQRLVSFIPPELRVYLPAPADDRRLFFAADLHLDGDALKVIELNCAVGYGHYAHLADRALRPLVEAHVGDVEPASDDDFAPFVYEHGLRPLHDADAGLIAFLRGFGGRDMFNVDELEGVAARIEECGGPRIPLCHEADLELREDGLHLAGEGRVDLLYVEENLSQWENLSQDSPVAEAVRAGRVKTFPPLDMFLYTSKGFLALLCDPAFQRRLEPDERESEVLRRNVLWSAELDERIEPAAYHMLDQGLRLVVKDALGGGGRGVTILRPESGSQQAGHILRQRLHRGRSVVQGYCEPGRWSEDSDLRFDLRILCAAHEGDITIGPIYGRIFRGSKLDLGNPDAGVAPVYVTP